MWPYPWTHVGTPSHLGHMDRVAATMPSQAHAGAAQEAPDIGQWEGQDVPLVRPSSCNVKGGVPSSRRYLPTYLDETAGCSKLCTRLISWEIDASWLSTIASTPCTRFSAFSKLRPIRRISSTILLVTRSQFNTLPSKPFNSSTNLSN